MNHNEDGLIQVMDRRRALGFAPALVNLVASRIIGKPSLQRYLADLVAGRTPGAAGSSLEGCTQAALWKIRSRFVREWLEAVRHLAVVTVDPAQSQALERLAAAIARCLPAVQPIGNGGRPTENLDAVDGLDSDGLVRAWVGLMKELRIPDIDFLIPGRRGWLTTAETQ